MSFLNQGQEDDGEETSPEEIMSGIFYFWYRPRDAHRLPNGHFVHKIIWVFSDWARAVLHANSCGHPRSAVIPITGVFLRSYYRPLNESSSTWILRKEFRDALKAKKDME